METINQICDKAVCAARATATLTTSRKNRILAAMAKGIISGTARILAANAADVKAASAAGLPAPMLKRLILDEAKISAMAAGMMHVARLRDPVGITLRKWKRPNGLVISKISVPIGVICVIFESRPNVTADSAALCFKSSNVVILRGGKEAMRSNAAIINAMTKAGRKAGLPDNAIQLVRTTDRSAVKELAGMSGKIDLIMPRGGEALIRAVADNARVPVIKHYKGVCHIYVDKSADTGKALDIIINAKCQNPAVCNAVEKVLVHRSIAAKFLPVMCDNLARRGVEVRGDAASRKIVPKLKAASAADWDTEYLDLIITVGIVDSVDSAIDHINRHGSHHSDAILTEDSRNRRMFLQQVDSAVVYSNASTRFTDGGEFGMGAEIGISTDKIHARGPMGLEELTTYKYIVTGKGQIRR